MKLRIRGNSIRLRLTKSEIDQFADTGIVEEIVEFGFTEPGLSYQLHATLDGEIMRAQFVDNCIRVSVPKREAENWINSDRVGIETVQHLGTDRSLRILIEKDFACRTERIDEDGTDAFPNPLANSTKSPVC
jgi:hypothetical protein